MENQSVIDMLVKHSIVGGVSAIGMIFYFGETDSVRFFGMTLPAPLVSFGVGAVSSSAADLAHKFILPHIPGNQRYSAIESAVLSPVVNGVSQLVVFGPLTSSIPSDQYMSAFMLGAVSEAVGGYAFENFYLNSNISE